MKYVYPAIFYAEDGVMQVSVPDLPGLHTFGENLADAMYMAQDAIEMWLWDAENKDEIIPSASDFADLFNRYKNTGHIVSLIAANTDEYRRQTETKLVRKSVTIPAWLNYMAEKAQVPFSQIFQQGLKEYLHVV